MTGKFIDDAPTPGPVAKPVRREPTSERWQPIATAPKGEIILYFPETDKHGRNYLPAMTQIGWANGFPFRRATHWMPLPAPPVVSQ